MTGSGDRQPALARAITPRLLLFLVVGNVLGAGIYAIVGEVVGEAGGLSWIAFGVAFATAAVSALSLCELVTKYPGASGVVVYVDRAFGRPAVSLAVGLAILASGLTSAATAARAFGGEYLEEFITLNATLTALAFIGALSALNWWGLVASLRANVAMTLVEAGGLVLVIVAASWVVGTGDGDPSRALDATPPDGGVIPMALLGGAAVAFFSFLGFEDVANMSEEVVEPPVAYPRAIFGGLAITAALYVTVVVLTLSVVPPRELAGSTGPLLRVVEASPLDSLVRVLAAVALVAVANTALANLMMGSRLVYGLSRKRLLPGRLSRVDRRRATPVVAVICVALLAAVLAASGDLGGLARTTVLLLLSVLILMNITAIRLRGEVVSHDHFVAPGWAPWLGGATCLALIVDQIAGSEPRDLARLGVIVALGALISVLATRVAPGADAREAGHATR